MPPPAPAATTPRVDPSDPLLALRWLAVARRGTLAAQVLLMVAAEAGTQLHLHSTSLLVLVAAWSLVDLGQLALFRRRAPSSGAVLAVTAVDLAVLSAILALSGGPHNPLLFAYLAWLALLGMVLPAPQAWLATGVAIALEAAVVFHPASTTGFAPEPLTTPHLVSHIATFDVSAAAITWVVTRLSQALRERAAAHAAAERRQALTDRLAALGTLAAGVAHELGTPLGAIQLLAERARGRDAEAELVALLEQVERCRGILDRLRGRDAPTAGSCTLDVSRWIDEWRRAAPDVDVQVEGAAERAQVAGAEESWRAAVWVALDNARKAGAQAVRVRVEAEPEVVRLAIEDDGRGLSPEVAAHVGEPFRTGWDGTGLGVFVARTFAQSVGGDVSVEPGVRGGATARISMPRVAA